MSDKLSAERDWGDEIMALTHSDLEDGVHEQLADAVQAEFAALEQRVEGLRETNRLVVKQANAERKTAEHYERRVEGLEKAGTEAFLNDDGLLWIGKAEDEHGYGMEFVGITLPKDRYFAFLKALATEEEA